MRVALMTTPPPISNIWDTNVAAQYESEGTFSALVQPVWPSARQYITDVVLKHQSVHQCYLPLELGTAPPQGRDANAPQTQSGLPWLGGTWFGWPMHQPTIMQNRDTGSILNFIRSRFPSNPISLYTILQYIIDFFPPETGPYTDEEIAELNRQSDEAIAIREAKAKIPPPEKPKVWTTVYNPQLAGVGY